LEFKEYGKKYDLSIINDAVEEIIENNRDWPIDKVLCLYSSKVAFV
jgi:hypothetical protein